MLFFFRNRKKPVTLSDESVQAIADELLRQIAAEFPDPGQIDQSLVDAHTAKEQLKLLQEAFALLERNQQTMQKNQQTILLHLQQVGDQVEKIARRTTPKKVKGKRGDDVIDSDPLPSLEHEEQQMI